MIYVNPLHGYFRESHLELVKREMLRLGPPTLRAHFDGGIWHAREGTHRLRAAKALGFVPRLVPVPWPKSKASLERAQFSALLNAHCFERVEIVGLS